MQDQRQVRSSVRCELLYCETWLIILRLTWFNHAKVVWKNKLLYYCWFNSVFTGLLRGEQRTVHFILPNPSLNRANSLRCNVLVPYLTNLSTLCTVAVKLLTKISMKHWGREKGNESKKRWRYWRHRVCCFHFDNKISKVIKFKSRNTPGEQYFFCDKEISRVNWSVQIKRSTIENQLFHNIYLNKFKLR